MQNVKFLQLNYTSSTEVMSTFPRADMAHTTETFKVDLKAEN
ncbi:hypothetical protein NC651_026153 [Populus alba x Populus x berolinensis]|nr:hypothetical protein NC651_026153 [Populus alba x Populus x berolinensis]